MNGLLYVPASEVSNSDSNSPSETPIAVYVTSNGKGTPRPFWWRGWKTRPWIRLLSGTISRPSTAARGAELWISSLRGSRASPPVQPGDGRAPTTTAGSGPTSRESFAKYDRDSSSWKTYRGYSMSITGEPLPPFSGTWPNSGTMRNGTCSRQKEWARRISGRGSSSSRSAPGTLTWPSPSTDSEPHYDKRRTKNLYRGPPVPNLPAIAKNWGTPNTSDSTSEKLRKSRIETGRTTDYLDRQTMMWPTPDATVGTGYNQTASPGAAKRPLLAGMSKSWPTPRASPN